MILKDTIDNTAKDSSGKTAMFLAWRRRHESIAEQIDDQLHKTQYGFRKNKSTTQATR